MKKNFVNLIPILMLVTFLLACSTTPKEPSIQELIMQGRYDEAKEIFKTKTDINAVDEYGDTALHVAARVNEADLVSFLVMK